MKMYQFMANSYSIGAVSSIRDKQDIILLLLNTIKYISSLTLEELRDANHQEITLIINVDKMSRVFYCKEEKIHTFQFPFSIIEENGNLKVYHDHYELDSKITSILIAIFKENMRYTESLDGMLDVFMENMEQFEVLDQYHNKICWDLFTHLLTFEPGYLRYDYDDDKSRLDENKHPLNHLDIYYTNKNTFKIGLNKKINSNDLIKVLNINEDCKFFK